MKYTLSERIPDFDGHQIVSSLHDRKTGLRGFITVHRFGKKKIAFGATRFVSYDSVLNAMEDAVRLSRLMTYKAALAGLPYGGAKGVIIKKKGVRYNKTELFRAYARMINIFGGHFITGMDAGLNERDLAVMAQESPYIVGLKGDASDFTAQGIFVAMGVCLKEMFGSSLFTDRSVAIQGLGKIGMQLLGHIYPVAKQVIVAEIDREKVRAAARKFPRVKTVPPTHIHRQNVDIYSPCALSNPINKKTISELKAKIIAGGANNQLEDERIGILLHRLDILYAPDYVINAGGLICVADEYEHKSHRRSRVERKVARIATTLQKIFGISRRRKRAPNIIADEMARRLIANV
jgi:leucine dehydrogenase